MGAPRRPRSTATSRRWPPCIRAAVTRARARALLAAGRARPLDLLEALGYRRVPAEELPNPESVRGFNTPEEYLHALREVERSPTAIVELRGAAREAAGRCEMEVPVGTLAEVLAPVQASVRVLEGEAIAREIAVSLPHCDRVRSAAIPVGAGERVVVNDAAAGS